MDDVDLPGGLGTLDPVWAGYDTDLELARYTLLTAAREVDGVSDRPSAEAFVEEFADSSINFALMYCHAARRRRIPFPHARGHPLRPLPQDPGHRPGGRQGQPDGRPDP